MNGRLIKTFGVLAVVVVVAGAVLINAPIAGAKAKLDPVEFRQDMRKLWEDHITWTRLVIISMFASLPDQSAATDRLLQNQVDLGNAIKPFYGDPAGAQLTALLRDHIVVAAEILQSMKVGACVPNADAVTRWYANGDDIAAFLNAANPEFWTLAEMQQMMQDHLDLTVAEANARCTGNWTGDVAAYDAIHLQALRMADMLSHGIIRQFPKMFK